MPEPLGHGHIGRNPLSVDVRPAVPVERMGVEPTRPSRQTVFGTVVAANRLASPNLATRRTNIMRRSPGATRRSLRPGHPRYSAPVLTTRYLALHCDCGGRENRTPIAKGSRVTADAHSTCLPPDPDCGATRKPSTPSPYVVDQIGKTKAASQKRPRKLLLRHVDELKIARWWIAFYHQRRACDALTVYRCSVPRHTSPAKGCR